MPTLPASFIGWQGLAPQGRKKDCLTLVAGCLMLSVMEAGTMTNEAASKHNSVRQTGSTTRMMMTVHGRIFDGYREQGNTIYEVDAYGGILNTYILGVNCVAVLRRRTTTVNETYEVE